MKKRLCLWLLILGAGASAEEPKLSLSANGSADTEWYRGWPLLLRARVVHSEFMMDSSVPPLVLSGGAGDWSRLIHVTLRNAAGSEVAWTLGRVEAQAQPQLVLDRSTVGEVNWYVTPQDAQLIAEGSYKLTAVLDTRGTDGWVGSASSRPVRLRVVEEPLPLTPDLQVRKARLLAAYAELTADSILARNAAEELAQLQPESYWSLLLQADALATEADLASRWRALTLYSEARRQFTLEFPGAKEPPLELDHKLVSLMQTLLLR